MKGGWRYVIWIPLPCRQHERRHLCTSYLFKRSGIFRTTIRVLPVAVVKHIKTGNRYSASKWREKKNLETAKPKKKKTRWVSPLSDSRNSEINESTSPHRSRWRTGAPSESHTGPKSFPRFFAYFYALFKFMPGSKGETGLTVLVTSTSVSAGTEFICVVFRCLSLGYLNFVMNERTSPLPRRYP